MTHKLIVNPTPWYRHPWPWILMVGPVTVIFAGVFTTYLAVVSNDGLVEDDYYKQGLAVNQMTARDQNAIRLGLQADVLQNAEDVTVRVVLRGKPEVALPESLKLSIQHPTRAGGDQNVLLRGTGDGAYTGRLNAPLMGRWRIALEDEKREWRLTGDWIVAKNPLLHLPAERVAVVRAHTDKKGK